MHLAYTFFTDQLTPVEGQMETAMKRVVPRISSGTTMWKAWVGFNVSHSMGLMLFGLIYGYLTVYQWEVLRRSYFLSGLGLLVLVGYVVLARVFWFKDPLIGSRRPLCSTLPDLFTHFDGIDEANSGMWFMRIL